MNTHSSATSGNVFLARVWIRNTQKSNLSNKVDEKYFFEDDMHATAEFILEVERYVNEKIFGEPDAPSGWKFPYEEKRLGEVKFSNWRKNVTL